jgi:hypothetical protein
MNDSKIFTVLTTINSPDERVSDWMKITGNQTIVVGDKKTPNSWIHSKCEFFSLKDQLSSDFAIASLLPENHYTRKNLGYLYAIKKGAQAIIDTDDDNFPIINQWKHLLGSNFDKFQLCNSDKISFKNIYSYFSDSDIPFWPRGFPLNLINDQNSDIDQCKILNASSKNVGLWQCMVDGDPDIDAIHRLIFKNTPRFNAKPALMMGNNIFCAFNSQNTLWLDSELFPLLYLPSTVSFRFTDILRGYIAQAVINTSSKNWGFYQATAYQERNEHNLMNDFRSEVSMYSNMDEIFHIIYDSCKIKHSISDNLINCYSELRKNDYVEENELKILNSWMADLNHLFK